MRMPTRTLLGLYLDSTRILLRFEKDCTRNVLGLSRTSRNYQDLCRIFFEFGEESKALEGSRGF